VNRWKPIAVCLLVLDGAQVAPAQVAFDLDTTFRTPLEVQYVNAVQPLSDGQLLLSGRIKLPGESFFRGSARIDADGGIDSSFPAFPLTTGSGEIVPWNSGFYVGTGAGVRRLDQEGLIDPTFILMNDGPYFTSLQGGDYHVYPDGRVLMSGAHMLDDPIRGFQGLYSLIWFSNTGYLDTTRTHRLCNGVIYEIEEQPDGKFLCTGSLTTYEGQPVGWVFRVEEDGTLDQTFNVPLQDLGRANDYHTLPDGRIVVGGFCRFGGVDPVRCLLRLNPDGSLDQSFTLLDFEDSSSALEIPLVNSIFPFAGGYIVTGTFDRINGQERGGIAMVDLDGNLLPEPFNGMGCGGFQDGVTFRRALAGITPAADGNFYIYGTYHGYDDGTTNDTTQRMVSRLYGLEVGVREEKAMALNVYPNPTSDAFMVRTTQPLVGGVLHLVDAAGRRVQTWNWPSDVVASELHVRGIPAGQYTLALDAQHTRVLGKLSILPE
jgi:uncharacterized delta-60 repeat protein